MKSPEKTIFEVILIVTIVLSVVLLPLAAEAKCAHHPPAFSDFDTNADGFISEEELNAGRAARMAERAASGHPMKGAASHPAFADLDTDGDGRLNEEEFLAGQKAHRQAMQTQMHGVHHGKGMHHGMGMKMPTFDDLDLDGDGCIDADEFARHHAEVHGKMNQKDAGQREE